jgi:hypothetical protein
MFFVFRLVGVENKKEKIDWFYSKTCETFLTIKLIYFLYSSKKFSSVAFVVIYRELRLHEAAKAKLGRERIKKRKRRKKTQNQNGKLMASRNNNTKLSFRLIGQLKRSDFNCSQKKRQQQQ